MVVDSITAGPAPEELTVPTTHPRVGDANASPVGCPTPDIGTGEPCDEPSSTTTPAGLVARAGVYPATATAVGLIELKGPG